jgi:hypothetical protein
MKDSNLRTASGNDLAVFPDRLSETMTAFGDIAVNLMFAIWQ